MTGKIDPRRVALLTADPYEARQIRRDLRAEELSDTWGAASLAARQTAVVDKIRELAESYGGVIVPDAVWNEDEADEGEYVSKTAEVFAEMRSDFEDFAEEMDDLLLEHEACQQALSTVRTRAADEDGGDA